MPVSSLSSTVYDDAPKLTCTAGVSSVINMLVERGLPALNPPGSVPSPMTTVSPVSATLSSVAWKVKLATRDPLLNAALAGTPE